MAGLLDPDDQLCALRGVSGSLEPLCGCHHTPGPAPAATAGQRLSRKGPRAGLWFLTFNRPSPFPAVTEKIELHHAPCSSGNASSDSNRATGDRHNGHAPCLASGISPSKQAWAARSEGLQRATKDKRVSLVSLQHLAERKTSFSFPGPAKPSPGLSGMGRPFKGIAFRYRHRFGLNLRPPPPPRTAICYPNPFRYIFILSLLSCAFAFKPVHDISEKSRTKHPPQR